MFKISPSELLCRRLLEASGAGRRLYRPFILNPNLLHCTALHCTALHCTVLHWTGLHCTALHCPALHCTAKHCTEENQGGFYRVDKEQSRALCSRRREAEQKLIRPAVWTVECGLLTVDCGLWTVDCGLWSAGLQKI